MSKKNFKGDLGNLLEGNGIKKQDKARSLDPESDLLIEKLRAIIVQQETELWKWRTGALTIELFITSLQNHNLKYVPERNSIEPN